VSEVTESIRAGRANNSSCSALSTEAGLGVVKTSNSLEPQPGEQSGTSDQEQEHGCKQLGLVRVAEVGRRYRDVILKRIASSLKDSVWFH